MQFESQGVAEHSERALTCIDGAAKRDCNVRANRTDVHDSRAASDGTGAVFYPNDRVRPKRHGGEPRACGHVATASAAVAGHRHRLNRSLRHASTRNLGAVHLLLCDASPKVPWETQRSFGCRPHHARADHDGGRTDRFHATYSNFSMTAQGSKGVVPGIAFGQRRSLSAGLAHEA